MSIGREPRGDVEMWTEVDGTVVIGPPPVGAAGLVFIALTDGLLAIDPMAPDSPPQLRVGDPLRLGAAEAVYGTEIAAAMPDATEEPIVFAVTESPERDALIRLGILRWLADRSPVPLDRAVLLVEECVLAIRLSDLLDDDHNRPGALLDWAAPLMEWARRARRTESEFRRTSAVLTLIEEALAEIEFHLAGDSGQLEEVRHEAELLRALTLLDLPAIDVEAEWAVIDELSPRGAEVMGAGGAFIRRGWGPVDWDRTPSWATARTEDAVSWRIVPQSGVDLLTVVVEAFPPSPHAELLVVPDSPAPRRPDLQAILYHGSWPLPLAAVELTARPENGALMGSYLLDEAVSRRIRTAEDQALSVEVQVRGLPRPPRTGADAQRASAVRWATRGLCSLRLASVAPPAAAAALRGTAAEALASAARRYGELPDDAGAEAAMQCAAVIASADTEGQAPDRQFWTPDDIVEQPAAMPGGDPVSGAARATAAEIWYAVAAPLSPESDI